MHTSQPQTVFATAARSPMSDILADHQLLQRSPIVEVLDAIPSPVLLLNECRQLVHGNKALWGYLRDSFPSEALGQRPGELCDCIYAKRSPGGCGTTEFCRECGAVRTIVSSLAGLADTQECNMLRELDGELTALNLLVHAVPYSSLGRPFTIFTINDISHLKRRRYLERIFFHDIINSAGNALGLVELLHEENKGATPGDLKLLLQSLTHLVNEVLAQKTLLTAESHELTARPEPLRSDAVLRRLAEQYAYHHEAEGKFIVIAKDSDDVDFVSDRALLGRVLGNMLKNALEASAPGQSVTAGCHADENVIRFSVHNPGCIPLAIQHQIFKRSFSSKGSDRGLGTFSIRLLTQNYLGGRAWFTSTPQQGTVFNVELPLRHEPETATA